MVYIYIKSVRLYTLVMVVVNLVIHYFIHNSYLNLTDLEDNKFYKDYLENISDSTNFIATSYNSIGAIEPIQTLFFYLSAVSFNTFESQILLLNMLVISSVSFLILKFKGDLYIKILLLISVHIGYYFFIAFEVTHRLKIAIFLTSLFVISDTKKMKYLFGVAAIASHLSIAFVVFPLYMLGAIDSVRYNFPRSGSINNKLMMIVGLFFIFYFIGNFNVTDMYLRVFESKINYFSIFLTPSAIMLIILTLLIHNRLISNFVFIVLFFTATMLMLGSSRIYMLFYFFIFFAYLSSLNFLKLKTSFGKVDVLVIILYIVSIHSIVRGIYTLFHVFNGVESIPGMLNHFLKSV